MSSFSVSSSRTEGAQRLLRAIALAGAAVFVLGLLLEPGRTWGGFLMGFHYFTGLALSGGLFLAVLVLCGARWADEASVVPRMLASRLPVAALLGLLLCLGISSIYEWSHPALVQGDALLQHKQPYLNAGGFTLRMVLYFAAWIWSARVLTRRFANPSSGRAQLLRAASVFMAVFAVGFSLASVDWIESLDPHWFSTIFALYTLAGIALSGLAAAILIVVGLSRAGVLDGEKSADVLDDLGKIAIALSLFWAYIWYCQYMLTWYTNMPEETGWFVARMRGPWQYLTPVNLLLNWAIPFLVLMPKAARRSATVLTRVAYVMLVGHALDLYILVEPSLHMTRPALGLWELGPLVGLLALFAAGVLDELSMLPVGRGPGTLRRSLVDRFPAGA